MTPEAFRSIALGFPGTIESAHRQHPDFRFKGKIFATLGYPDGGWGMVKLSPDQQRSFLKKAPEVFGLASGAWGRSGSTTIRLASAKKAIVKAAIFTAYKNQVASKKRAFPLMPALTRPPAGGNQGRVKLGPIGVRQPSTDHP